MTERDPLYVPKTGRKMFKVCVHNAQVREMVKANQSHSLYDDDWAEIHCQQVSARDEAEARALTEERFPTEDGFVVTEITALPFSS